TSDGRCGNRPGQGAVRCHSTLLQHDRAKMPPAGVERGPIGSLSYSQRAELALFHVYASRRIRRNMIAASLRLGNAHPNGSDARSEEKKMMIALSQRAVKLMMLCD